MENSFNKVIDLLFLARQEGVEVIFNNDRLQLKIAEDKDIDENLFKEIKNNKQSIIDYLTSDTWKAKSVNENHNKIVLYNRDSITHIPLSFSQERLWFIDQLEGSMQYNSPAVLRLTGNLDKDALVYSLRTIINRHEVLKTVFHENGGQVYQSVIENEQWQLQFVEGSMYKEGGDALKLFIAQLIEQPFDLSNDYPVRASLIHLDKMEYVLVIIIHHIASDAWSIPIIIKELVELYNSFVQGREARLTPLPLQYADYALWQRNYLQGEVLAHKLQYWTDKLHQVTALHLPTDYSRPPVLSTKGESVSFLIDKQTSDQLYSICQQYGTTLFMTLLSVFKVMLYRYSGQQDICVGTSIASRQRKELEGLIGFFVNTLALRSQLSGDMAFTDLLQQVKATTLEAYQHQDVPFEKVVETVVKERDPARNPLFQVMLVLSNTPQASTLSLDGLQLLPEDYEHHTAKFDITFFMTETPEGLQGTVQYSTDLYGQRTINSMVAHFKVLLSAVVKEPQQNIGLLKMLTQAEEQQLLEQFNGSKVVYPKNKSIVDLFEEQVIKTPQATAVVFEGRELSYTALNERSNQLAHYLQSKAVQPDTPVALYVERSATMMIAMLAIMKAGGAYLPIDTDLPWQRISYMLQDAGVKVIVSSSADAARLEVQPGIEIVQADSMEKTGHQPKSNLLTKPLPSHLAYVIYTSGSTGKAKGVMIEHRSLVDYYYGLKQSIHIEQCRSFALVSAIATDLGNTVIYASLLSGGALHVFSKESVGDMQYLQGYFEQHSIECVKIVPSHWKALSREEGMLLPRKLLVFGGEALQGQVVEAIRSSGSGCRVVNHYGPTETTIGKLLHEPGMEQGGSYDKTIAVGRPFSNTRVYVLSKEMQLCPVGVAGQLYIAGDGLARGYVNNEDLTREKFVADPFEQEGSSRMYGTGDVVKWSQQGNIMFIGRSDDQVKIRGYRVEPGEVQAMVEQSGMVSQAVVMARDDSQGDKRLVAYIVAQQGFDREAVIEYLRDKLPAYMVPARWVELEGIPLTSNGKVDRKALPDEDAAESSKGRYVAPGNETEAKLVSIWQEVLEVERVGVHDDFFELGGHSLLAVRLISSMRKAFEVEIRIGDVFDYPTIRQLAAHLEQQSKGLLVPSIQKVDPRPDRIPLSFSQERLWFIDQLGGSVHYHVPSVLRLKGELDSTALSHAMRQLIDRHEVLRSVIRQQEGIGYQVVKDAQHWQLQQVDGQPYQQDGSGLQHYIKACVDAPFDLSADYMVRATLISLHHQDHVLVVTLHHIASDGWSASIMVKELMELYNAYVQQRTPSLAELPVQYADYAIWQRTHSRGEAWERKMGYWKDKLEGAAVLQLPVDYARPLIQSTKGAVTHFWIDKSLSQQLQGFNQQQGVTMFMTLLAAFKVLLYRYSGQQDICVGTPIAGRQQQELEGLIGFFVNTLAMRTVLGAEMSFVEVVEAVRKTTLEAYEHQEVPFEKVVEAVVKERDMSRSPLFQVMFMFNNVPHVQPLHTGELQVSDAMEGSSNYSSSKFDITFNITESAEGLSVAVEYCTDLYREQTIKRMEAHFTALINSAVNAPHQSIGSLVMLSRREQQQLLVEFNDTRAYYPADKTIVELFEQQVEKTPDSVAVVFEDRQLTYRELNERSNQLARYLRSKGVGQETMVPICIERGIEMIIAILGILKAGGAYVPIDPSYPQDRISFMVQDVAASVVVSSEQSRAKLAVSTSVTLIDIIKDGELIDEHEVGNLGVNASPDNLAYVIYTSGSTGKPKGVMIEHGSVVNLIKAQSEFFGIDPEERILQFSNYCFDASVEQIFLALFNGASLVLLPEGVQLNLKLFERFLREERISHLHATPSFLENVHLVDHSSLKRVIAGGEACKKELSSRWRNKVDFYNEYGPTETTVTAIEYSDDNNFERINSIPIGRPLSNTQAYVLNREGALCPIGVPGEICIGGVQVARGYVNRPELTADRFVSDPFSKQPGARMYKTGDIGRWLEDGNIEYLGRKDDQVKIRGYRIELGEIENVLLQSGLIKQAVVQAKQDKEGNQRLVGYLVAEGTFNKEAILSYLQAKLPEYMIPALWVDLECLPLNNNGKVDKKNLPDADSSTSRGSNYVAAGNEIEKLLVEIWQELLGVDRIGIHDNFFELGGHSLLGMRLVSLIRKELEAELSIKSLFFHPTIGQLAAHLEQQSKGLLVPSIQKVDPRPDRIPLSFSQERLWFIDQLGGSVHYHVPSVLRLKGELDSTALSHAMRQLIDRHEVLRSVIHQQEGIGYQVVKDAQHWQLQQVDGQSYQQDGSGLQHYIKACVDAPFDLSADYMVRATLISLHHQDHVLVVTLHHIASDGWSASIMVKELMELYNAYVQQRTPSLAELPVQYADYAIWQRTHSRGEAWERKLGYWKDKLEGAAVLQLPVDYARPLIQSTKGAVTHFWIDKSLSQQLQGFNQQQGVTMFMTLLAAFKVLLYRYSGQQDICVGTPIAGRQQQELEGLIGFFVNTLAMRTVLGAEMSFVEVVEAVRKTTLEAYEHQEVPFEKVVEAVVKERDMSRSPLFQVMFMFNNVPHVQPLHTGELQVSDAMEGSSNYSSSKFDITFNITESAEGLSVAVEYCTDLYREQTIKRMEAHFTALINSAVNAPHQSIGSLVMLSRREQQQLLVEFNDTRAYYPADKTIVELFEQQVQKTPDSVAVVFEDRQLTYRELNERSNQLARYLRSKGVGQETMVPICIERGIEMIIAILGILKAGGAYVPIDPSYPQDRISFMVQDVAASVVVSSEQSRAKLAVSTGVTLIDINRDRMLIDEQQRSNLGVNASPDNLAYVIYTSGSTGKPKGVLIEHGSVVNLITSIADRVQFKSNASLLAVTTYSFDISYLELFMPLLFAGRLIIMPKEAAMDGFVLSERIAAYKPVYMQATPSSWRMLLDSGWQNKEGLMMLTGGEAISEDVKDSLTRIGEVYNCYGPTETTIWSVMKKLAAREKVVIGKPLSNTNIAILNDHAQLCPVGVAGEICITGKGLARGYLNLPHLTAEKFVKYPFSYEGSGSRMYKTGDLGRWLADGNIEYLGRMDNQVKIRGYRIELGEIENVLLQSGMVSQAVVMARDDSQGDKRLVAYIVAQQGFDREAVIEYLRDKLPAYMIPARWVELEGIPLTSNGKVDRKALPDEDAAESSKGRYVAPGNETEAKLVSIWQEVLEVERVGVHDDFFELGGHSLLAVRLISSMRKAFEVEIRIGDVFDYPTIRQLAAHLEQQSKGLLVPSIQKVDPRPDRIPLSFSQERLWFIDQLGGSVHYHVPSVLRLKGELDSTALSHAMRQLIDRHEVLRSVIHQQEGIGYQVVKDAQGWQLQQVDGQSYQQDGSGLQHYIKACVDAPFDLSADYMVRATLISLHHQDHVLVVTLHHIASDGWSASIMVKELMELYNAYVQQRTPSLAELPVQYADYAIWQRTHSRGEAWERKMGYWKDKLEGAAVLQLPVDYARPLIQSTKGAVTHFWIDKSLSQQLQGFNQQQGVTMFMTLLAAFKVLLYRYSGQQDICVGTPIAGRQQQELEGLIGFFVNTLAMRTVLGAEMSFVEVVEAVRKTTLEAYEHQEVPFEKVVEAVVKERDMSRSPLFQVMFMFNNVPHVQPLHTGELQVSDAMEGSSNYSSSKFDITFNITESAEGLSVAVEYCTDLYREQTIKRMEAHFTALINSAVNAPHQSIGSLVMLSRREEQQLLVEFNDTRADYPADKTIVELFEQQVQKTPGSVAVVFEDRQLTYRELNERSNQLARYLRSKGVGQETMVPICIERGIEMIIAILGILKAGGAYVPIDPSYPQDRISFMLQDVAASVVVSSEQSRAKLAVSTGVTLIDINRDRMLIDEQQRSNLGVNASPDNLAYVIYTSGSTGKPKGVMIEHGSVVSLVKGVHYVSFGSENILLSTGSSSFDATTFEYWGMLLNGGRLILCAENRLLDNTLLKEEINKRSVNIMWFTSSWFNQLVEADIALFKNLETVMVGGEKLSEKHIVRLRQSNPSVTIINGYGPTENTTFSLTYRITETETYTSIPIGRPLSNRSACILDDHEQLIPIGVSGEICLSGAGLSKGYLNQPELTAQKFVKNPFSERRGAMMYKTGDLGRWLEDGNIEYLGRKDEQVKIRGYRIEPGEIENVLLQSGLVSQCVVIVKEDAQGIKRLVAYFIPLDGFNKDEVIFYLQSKLPEYMVPALWMELENLPLTSNGKVNRNALPEVDASELLNNEFITPRTELEENLAEIWRVLLGVEAVGIHDNFFELGGDSILTIQIVNRAKRMGYELQAKDVFIHQTIAGLSALIAERTASPHMGEQAVLKGNSGLLPIQQWYLQKNEAAVSHFNQAVLLSIDKSLTQAMLQQAIIQLTLHHDALRLRYTRADGQWQQEYGSSQGTVVSEDLQLDPEGSLAILIKQHADHHQQQLDIEKGELVRIVLMHTPATESHNRLLVVIHHLAIDGVSWRILLEDLDVLLTGVSQAQQVNLGQKSSSYRQWYQALEQYGQSSALLSQIGYWQHTLQSYTPLRDDKRYKGKISLKDTRQCVIKLSKGQTRRLLREVPRAYHTEINDILLCALAVSLCEWSGSSEVVIGLEGHGREEIEQGIDTNRTVGWFTSLYPVLLQVAEGWSAGEQIKSVKEQLRRIPGKGLGFGVLKYINREEALQVKSAWDIVFNYLGQFDNVVHKSKWLAGAVESAGASISEEGEISEKLSVNSSIQSDELVMSWRYSSLHYEASTITKLADAYMSKLEELIFCCLQQLQSGTVYTPSDYGLGKEISYSELDSFLEEAFNDKKRKDQLEGLYRLSALQQGMLFHSLYDQQVEAYIEQFSCDLLYANLDHLVSSWQHVVQNHSVLRSGFYYDVFSIPVQCVYRQVTLPLQELDYSAMSSEEQAGAVKHYQAADRSQGFDFRSAPLMRISLLKLSADRYRMIWTFHHIILDGWSLQVVMEEFLSTYESLATGAPLRKQQEDKYEDYIRYIEKSDKEAEKNYWSQYLQGVEQSTLLPFITTTTQRTKGAGSYRSLPFVLDAVTTEKIQVYAQKQRLTVSTVMQGVWSLLLHRYTGNNDVVFGMIVSGRPDDLPNVEKRIGMYINTLPVHSSLQNEQNITQWLHQLQHQQVASLQYQHAPLHATQTWSGIQGDFFDSILVFENYPVSEIIGSGQWSLGIEHVELLEQTNYPFSITIQNADKIHIDFSYNADLLKQEYAEQIRGHFEHVLQQLVVNADSPLSEIELLTATEKNRLLIEFNGTQANYPKDKTIVDLFEQQAEKTPDYVAVVFEDRQLTYRQLNQYSNQLAHYLRNKGVREETRVPVCMDRSVELIVAMLGILKAGGAYVFIDTDYPEDRIKYMMRDTETNMILVSHKSGVKLQNIENIDVIDINEQEKIIDQQPKNRVEILARPSHLAYVIYTSGSVGRPKGVMIEHASLLNYVQLFKNYFSVSSEDTVILQSSPSFDIIVEETFPALISGACIYIIKEGGKDITTLKSCIESRKATIISTTPMVIESLNKELADIGKLRYVIIGGDVLYPSNIDHLFDKVRIVNGYGPSETTVCATYNRIEKIAEASLIGKPIDNVGVYIVDKDENLVPIGIPGEIYIGGAGVARGYLNNAELTAQKFISNPFSKEKGSRLYRSGDIGRWLPDGNIEYLGRMDYQAKIRGYRIEPGEIESMLLQCELVEQCVVLAQESAHGNKRLVGYIVPHGLFDREGIIDYLKGRLPAYMVPAIWVELENLPLTSSGKINRKALPDTNAMELSGKQFVAPRNELEIKLADIWKEILLVEQIGIKDSFFDLGGHSLLAMRFTSYLRRELKIDLPIRTFFELHTIEELANYIKIIQSNYNFKFEDYETIEL